MHEKVTATPQDVRYGNREVELSWETAPGVRERGLPAGHVHRVGPAVPAAVSDHPQAAGALRGRGRRTGHHPGGISPALRRVVTVRARTFAEKAGAVLADDPGPVPHLGMDEHRRGRPGGGRTRRPASMSWSLTGGTPVSMTCPGTRACWARSRARPPTMLRTGWPARRRPGRTRSRSWPPACARPASPR